MENTQTYTYKMIVTALAGMARENEKEITRQNTPFSQLTL